MNFVFSAWFTNEAFYLDCLWKAIQQWGGIQGSLVVRCTLCKVRSNRSLSSTKDIQVWIRQAAKQYSKNIQNSNTRLSPLNLREELALGAFVLCR